MEESQGSVICAYLTKLLCVFVRVGWDAGSVLCMS